MNRRLAASALLAALLLRPAPARADAPTAGEIAALLRPDRILQVALAPDGHHLAYTVHDEGKTVIFIIDVDDPAKRAVVPLAYDEVMRDSGDHEKTPAHVPFFRWSGSGRLVFSAERPALDVVDVRRKNAPANTTAVYAVDADGKHVLMLADEDTFAVETMRGNDPVSLPREPRVVDLAADDPDSVLVEAVRPALRVPGNPNATVGQLATGLFKVNVHTGKFQKLYERDVNGSVLYDRQGNARILLSAPIDQKVQSFFYLPPPAGQADGKGLGQLLGDDISPENYLGTRTFPVGFDPDPNIVYVASNAGRDTYGLYAVDLRARRRTGFAVEVPGFDVAGFQAPFSDSDLVFDRSRGKLVGVRINGLEASTQWLDPDLAQVQAALDGKLSGRSARIVDWDDARARFLVLTSGGADPGRYYIYQREQDRLVQFIRCAPWIDLDKANPGTSFAFDTPEGVHLTGYLTLPRAPLITPPPLLVYCHAGPWQRDDPGFNRDAQVLAGMGFVVLQVNYRGSAGFGTQFREAIRQDLDRIPLADIRAAISWASAGHKIDRKRVALLGEGFGGYLALRALQLYPDEFRCAVTINAPTDLELWCEKPESKQEQEDDMEASATSMRQMQRYFRSMNSRGGARPPAQPPEMAVAPVNFSSEFRRWYFGGDSARLAALSPARHPELLTKPLLLIQDPEDKYVSAGQASALRTAMARAGATPDYLEITSEFARGLPGARTRVFTAMEDFFNLNLYDFNVKIGETKVQK